jgi:hypothetical protein
MFLFFAHAQPEFSFVLKRCRMPPRGARLAQSTRVRIKRWHPYDPMTACELEIGIRNVDDACGQDAWVAGRRPREREAVGRAESAE